MRLIDAILNTHADGPQFGAESSQTRWNVLSRLALSASGGSSILYDARPCRGVNLAHAEEGKRWRHEGKGRVLAVDAIRGSGAWCRSRRSLIHRNDSPYRRLLGGCTRSPLPEDSATVMGRSISLRIRFRAML